MSWPQIHTSSKTQEQQSISKCPTSKEDLNFTFYNWSDKKVEGKRCKDSSPSPHSGGLERMLCPDEARVLERANQIVMYVAVDRIF